MTTRKKQNKSAAGTALIRSSAAEYLTFVAAGGSSEISVEMRYEDENIWLTQKMMAELYAVSVPAINQHLKRIYADNELEEASVVKQYLITAADGKGYQTKHYNLQAIIAVGFKIENERAVQFRKWANQIVQDRLWERRRPRRQLVQRKEPTGTSALPGMPSSCWCRSCGFRSFGERMDGQKSHSEQQPTSIRQTAGCRNHLSISTLSQLMRES